VTPLKRHYRQRCQERVRSGLQFGYCCVGSSLGLMLVLLAVGVMNIAWMAVVAIVVLVQKVLPPKAALDVPAALAIIALGIGVVAF
jgi:predicted metal-binding membrane protein